jgi:hypothetical protein
MLQPAGKDEAYVYDVSARELVRVIAQHFPYGTTSGKLKEQFGKDTGLKKQTYYNVLDVAKAKQWIVGGGGKKGQRYSLNPNGCGRKPWWIVQYAQLNSLAQRLISPVDR